jgi:hypothetical protein
MAIKAQASNQTTKITVKQSNQNLPIELGQSAQHYNNLAKQWAISPNIVENEDYSSKYYAEISKQKTQEVIEQIASGEAVLNELNTTKEVVLQEINERTEFYVTTLREEKNDCTNQIINATQNATAEIIDSIDEIKNIIPMFTPFWSDHLYNNVSYLRADNFSWHYASIYVTGYSILEEEYNNENSIEQIEDNIIYKLTPNGFKIANIDQQDNINILYENNEKAWFYIIDTANKAFKLPREKNESGKYLYFFIGKYSQLETEIDLAQITNALNNKIDLDVQNYKGSKLEEYIHKYNSSGFNLFDTKISDYILEGNEAKGWALQGTYVTKKSYPNFYNKCLEQKLSGVETQVTLGESTLAIFVNSNGHQFYSITDKIIVDNFYETYGIADYYGIDEENQRIFLPRNKYFHQLTDDVSKVNQMMEAGLPNITGKINTGSGYGTTSGAFYEISSHSGNGANSHTNYIKGFDASRSSSIYGNSDTVQPSSSLKLLYYCVGNTEVTSAVTNVTEVTTSENDTIPLFTGMYFDFKPNNASWLKAGQQQNNSGIYKTCYDTLVQIVNGVNNYDLKVINQADMVSGVVYDEYWILNQDNMTFKTPLKISSRSYEPIAPVVGNGMTLGMTNGTNNFGAFLANSYGMYGDVNAYGKNVGSGASESRLETRTVGVTIDPTKSGIEAHLVENKTAQLYFKVANAVQNLELLDAGEVLEGLADKLDRGNKEEIASWGMPDYNAVVAVTFPFTAPTVGVLNISTNKSQTGKHVMTINDKTVAGHNNSSNQYYTNIGGQFFLNKDDVVKLDTNLSVQVAVFCPLKGVK